MKHVNPSTAFPDFVKFKLFMEEGAKNYYQNFLWHDVGHSFSENKDLRDIWLCQNTKAINMLDSGGGKK